MAATRSAQPKISQHPQAQSATTAQCRAAPSTPLGLCGLDAGALRRQRVEHEHERPARPPAQPCSCGVGCSPDAGGVLRTKVKLRSS